MSHLQTGTSNMQEEEQGLRALDFDDLTDFSNYDEPELDGITPQDHHQAHTFNDPNPKLLSTFTALPTGTSTPSPSYNASDRPFKGYQRTNGFANGAGAIIPVSTSHPRHTPPLQYSNSAEYSDLLNANTFTSNLPQQSNSFQHPAYALMQFGNGGFDNHGCAPTQQHPQMYTTNRTPAVDGTRPKPFASLHNGGPSGLQPFGSSSTRLSPSSTPPSDEPEPAEYHFTQTQYDELTLRIHRSGYRLGQDQGHLNGIRAAEKKQLKTLKSEFRFLERELSAPITDEHDKLPSHANRSDYDKGQDDGYLKGIREGKMKRLGKLKSDIQALEQNMHPIVVDGLSRPEFTHSSGPAYLQADNPMSNFVPSPLTASAPPANTGGQSFPHPNVGLFAL